MAKRSDNAVAGAPPSSAKARRGSLDARPDDSRQLAKSADPAYMKFTTYIRKATHLGVKTRLVSKQMEFSDLVEELLARWLKENESIVT
ncbi:MAG: hypothetical protein ABR881_31735 [Candidatus Sulfotelmatobacter sp.]|jgi:hypothetical protein